MSKIINGKDIAEKLLNQLKSEIQAAKTETNNSPQLSIIMIGENKESEIYVKNKILKAKEIGVETSLYELPENCPEKDIEFLIETLNEDENVNGIIVQLPLPKGLNPDKIINKINPEKDVDGFTDKNQNSLVKGDSDFIFPATPLAILELINEYENDLKNKKICVIGKSKTVGSPVATMLKNLGSNIFIVDKKTKSPSQLSSECDIVIAAAGSKFLVNKDWIKKDAIVIDVGINKEESGKLFGDVDFEDVFEKVKAITPVPGGVGPMTIAMLLQNTVRAFEKQNKIN